MGIAAVFGAILTMYTAVATRTREIATLRALGFNTLSVLVSVVGESMALAAIGGVAGGLLAYLGFNGYETATMNFQTFSQVAFAFAVTPALLVQGVGYALVMGFIGGVAPAIRAARLPISSALRELKSLIGSLILLSPAGLKGQPSWGRGRLHHPSPSGGVKAPRPN